MKRIIHIHARCDAFEIFEQVEESKAVERLKTIKRMFLKAERLNPGELVVTTVLVNPTLF